VYALNFTFTDAEVSITSLEAIILGCDRSLKRKNTSIMNDNDRLRTSEVCCPRSPKQKKS
jgi:hypothetical protein